MTQKYPVTVQEMDRVSKEIGLTAGYNDTAMTQICLIKRLGFDVDLEMYEHEVKNINAKPTHKVIDIDSGKTICTLPIQDGGNVPTYRTAIVPIDEAAADNADIAEWLDSMTPVQRRIIELVTEPDGCGNDDLYDWARGG
jgi:hypothetical protein